jgi:beta-ribofuranosylaminobenzene 5'-phosphate synthase
MEDALRLERPSADNLANAAVSVETSARLHFGFLDPSGRGKRPFGSFGLAIDGPRTRLEIRRAPAFDVSGEDCARAGPYLRKVVTALGCSSPYSLHLHEAIPPHSGLGSGTQLALAIGAAVAALEGIALDLRALAARLDRGKRSGIGIATFAEGGAVLDAGPGSESLPPILSRLPFPAEWRVLLIFDPMASGLHGADEIQAFEKVQEFSEAETAELCRRVLLEALPAVAEKNFEAFCDSVGYVQERMGAYFGPLQGGAYVSPDVAKVLHRLKKEGVTGLGQSSWGPTGFAFARSDSEARSMLQKAREAAEGTHLLLEIVRGRNRPATIERIMREP